MNSPLTDKLIHNDMSPPFTSQLLLKRSLNKPHSTSSGAKTPNTAVSVTDISESSNNTSITDRLLNTHSTISDHQEIVSLKKLSKKTNSNNQLLSSVKSTSKGNIVKIKMPSSSKNLSLFCLNAKEQSILSSKKNFIQNNLVKSSELMYDFDQGPDQWMKSQEDISQMLTINERIAKESKFHKKLRKKQNKNRIGTSSKHMSSKSKAFDDNQDYTSDILKCKFRNYLSSYSKPFLLCIVPNDEQLCDENHLEKLSNYLYSRPAIRFPITQIEKFECGTIRPLYHRSSIVRQMSCLPSIHNPQQLVSRLNSTTEPITDQIYSLMSSKNVDDKQAFESILNWEQQQQQNLKSPNEKNKFQHAYLLDTSVKTSFRGRPYPILTDEIDMIDDPNACTIVNKWAFADLVNAEREKFLEESRDNNIKSKKRSNKNNNFKICLRKRPLAQFEQDLFKEVDIVSAPDMQTIFLHIPSITVDNQVFVKNRKFKCDQVFDEQCQTSTIYHATLAPLLDQAIDGAK